ncbi:MAG: rhodanese-like domain-containing protein [Verrucomicrobiota bacterium]
MTAAAIRSIALACGSAALVCCGPPTTGPARLSSRPAAAGPVAPAAQSATPKPGTITRIPLAAFFPLQQSTTALIYDVRPGFFYGLGHIPGARSWPKSQFSAQLASREAEIRSAQLAKHPVILYCTDPACPDSNKVAALLVALGYSVSILDGGYATWKAAELPTE